MNFQRKLGIKLIKKNEPPSHVDDPIRDRIVTHKIQLSFGECDIYVGYFESVIPRFHITDNKDFHTCILFDKAKYFMPWKYTGRLSEKDKKLLNEWCNFDDPRRLFRILNWNALRDVWVGEHEMWYKENYKKKRAIPDYTKL